MIDTENKRRSAGGALATQVLPLADGSLDGGDRQHAAFLYRGIAAGAPATGDTAQQPMLWVGPKG
jgi:hypothetical protein